MKAQDIRDQFVKFFQNQGHEVISSSSLIPHNDPTLLFANAGMNQFKDYFTGAETPSNKRAVTIQKCVRAGGKHNDLENVGETARHHTFFEMLGNFSFGDYFKEDAINFAWTFLTKELKLDKDKLYVTVHNSDEEARMIWHEKQGVPLDRIFYRDDKDNFWEMGDVGPCGPCSEIFYDHGQEYTDGADTSDCILDDEGRYVEIWNLVFMQYEKYKENGEVKRKPLPSPSVDTGAGLERLAACLQEKYWNYDTDIFTVLINKIESITGKKYSDPKYQTPIRVLCDHIRSSVMLITDGVIPSNEGRGYVLRRIIRRAIRFLDQLDISDNSFHLLIPEVFETLGKQYPENKKNHELADKLIRLEEEKFRKTLKVGLDLIKKEIKNTQNELFSGVAAFKLYDTYGFPIDLTEQILKDNQLKLNHKEFEAEMKKQVELSRGAANFSADDSLKKTFFEIKQKTGSTEFTGYTDLNSKSKLHHIIETEEHDLLVFDKTPFYPEGGGQVGDIGMAGDAEIIDTQKPIDDFIVHVVKKDHNLKEGQTVSLGVNKKARELTKRNHTATHLLQAALIDVLGNHIKQAGSRVNPEGLRFDFTHTEPLKKDEIQKIETLVNEKIQQGIQVEAQLMSKEDADKKGAMALFGEKYGNEVRVLSVDNFSVELCGGTHVSSTDEIQQFILKTESSLASGVRRIEALTSQGAVEYLMDRSSQLASIEQSFSAKGSALSQKVNDIQKEVKQKAKEITLLKDQLQSIQSQSLFDASETLANGIDLHLVDYSDGSAKDFRNISDKFIDKYPKGVLVLYGVEKDKVSILIRTHKQNKNIPCSPILKEGLELLNGRGGGRPDMGQGSGESANLPKALELFKNRLGEL